MMVASAAFMVFMSVAGAAFAVFMIDVAGKI
jgi:hypothetical protein